MLKLTDFRAGLLKLVGSVMPAGGSDRADAYGGRGKDVFSIAIQKCRVLEIRYEGCIGYLRIEPHVYGRREDDSRFLLGYRLNPTPEHGQTEGWITLDIAKIVSACPSRDTFDRTRQAPEQPQPAERSLTA